MRLTDFIVARIWNNLKNNFLDKENRYLTNKRLIKEIRAIYNLKIDDKKLLFLIKLARRKVRKKWEKSRSKVQGWSSRYGLPSDFIFRFYLLGYFRSSKDVRLFTEVFVDLCEIVGGRPVDAFIASVKSQEIANRARARMIDKEYKMLKSSDDDHQYRKVEVNQ